MGKTIGDWRKKRGEEVKKNMERWKENKYRVEESKAHVSDKCLNILVIIVLHRTKLKRLNLEKQHRLSGTRPINLRT